MKKTSIFAASALALLTALGMSGASMASSTSATLLPGVHGGNAYGTWANAIAGDIATQLGRSAFQPCPCRGTDGDVVSSTAQNVSSGSAAKTRRIDTSVQADKTAATAYTLLKSSTEGTSLLDGKVTAGLIRAVADTSATESRIKSTAKNSQFGQLKVLGRPVNDVRPNTLMALPGFGHMLLRETVRQGDGVKRGAISVNMIHLFITQPNTLNIPVGSEIIVGHAQSAYSRAQRDTAFSGYAYATSGTSSSQQTTNQLGRSAAIYLGCTGTSSRTNTNTINHTSAPSMQSGIGSTSVMGGFKGSVANAIATSTVQDVQLLSGVITADSVHGVAHSSYDTSIFKGATTFNGSRFVNLRVAGRAVPNNVAPNTRMNLPGIGYVILNRQDQSATDQSATARIVMIEVHVTLANALNLPAGTTLRAGVASATVAPF